MNQIPFNTILIVDDEANMLDMLSASLRRQGYEVTTAAEGRQAISYLLAKTFTFVLCDLKMPVMDGLQFLAEVQKHRLDTTVIMMSAYATVDTAVQAMKCGAYDFITKPFKIDEILCILAKAAERHRLQQENTNLRRKIEELESSDGFAAIIGESKALQDIVNLARRVAGHETTVLITGESGTGKELLAKGIHQASARKGGPFVSINCGAIPANLLESEFFGYKKGAFTGADADHKGLFAAASGGTLFLDEVGELPLSLQVKLLRVLQEREIRPLGANVSQRINVRVLAATATNLVEAVAQGSFRQDLFFRINVVELQMPPLRERVGDIPILVSALFASESIRMNIPFKGISKAALNMLYAYSWPGNIRELKNVLEHALIYAENGWVGPESFPAHLGQTGTVAGEVSILADIYSIKEGKILLEKYLIEKALQKTQGNKSQAADLLEMSYPSLLNKIKEYGLEGNRFSKQGDVS